LASPAGNVGGITQALWEALHGGKVNSVPNCENLSLHQAGSMDVALGCQFGVAVSHTANNVETFI
jgi:hypothetical protein